MKRILLSGCNGIMGKLIAKKIAARDDCEIVAGVDINPESINGFPVFKDVQEFTGDVDVMIDFSHPSAVPSLLQYIQQRRLPAVIATTGLGVELNREVHVAAETIPIFFSATMSLGINLLLELAKKAAAVLYPDCDIEIIEKHHNQKIDAPSGTALMLAKGIGKVLPEPMHNVFDRHTQQKKREKTEIGIHAIRGGTIPGDHEIIFAGSDEVMTLSHSVLSKEVFANGSISAALFVCEQSPGLYTMRNMIESKI